MSIKKKFQVFALACVSSVALFAQGVNAKTVNVAVSIVPEATFAKAVGGDYLNVTTTIPSGSSPENYEPTAKQMEDLENADLYFSIGVPAETASILPKLPKDLTVVKLPNLVRKTYADRKLGQERDPHIWLSPKRAQLMTLIMAKELSNIDPAHANEFMANAKAYNEKIQAAEEQIKQALADKKTTSFITYHPAFGYFAEDFGLKMHALEEEGKEASAKQIAQMIDLAKKEGIKAVFYQAEMAFNYHRLVVIISIILLKWVTHLKHTYDLSIRSKKSVRPL